jgi:hypothetical protein
MALNASYNFGGTTGEKHFYAEFYMKNKVLILGKELFYEVQY